MRTRFLAAGCLACVAFACHAPSDRRAPKPVRQPIAPTPAEVGTQRAAAKSRWLAGDLAGALAELDRTGDDPESLALRARAQLMAGRDADAHKTAALAFRGRQPMPHLPTDVSDIQAIVVSSDGAYVAIVDHGTTNYSLEQIPSYRRVRHVVRVWNTLEGRAVFAARGERALFGRGSAGEMLAVIVDDDNLRVVDAATGSERWHHDAAKNHDRIYDVAVDNRGTLTVLSSPTLAQWDLSTGKKLRAFESHANTDRMVLAADGRTALLGAALYDLSADPTKLFDTAADGSGEARVSPDGQTIAVSDKDGNVALVGRDGKTRVRLEHAGSHIGFLDDGSLAAALGKRVSRWSVTTGKLLGELVLPASVVEADGRGWTFGTGGHLIARRGRELALFEMKTSSPTPIATFGWASRVDALTWSRDGTKLAIATARDEVISWSVAGELLAQSAHTGAVHELAFDAHGDVMIDPDTRIDPGFVINGRRVFARDATGHAVRFGEAPELITGAARGGDTLVAAGVSGAIYLWLSSTGEGLGTLDGGEMISALALRPDGRTLAVARVTGGIELWDLPSHKIVAGLGVWHGGWVAYNAHGDVAGDTRVLAWSHDGMTLPFAGTDSQTTNNVVAGALASSPPTWSSPRSPAATLPVRSCMPSFQGHSAHLASIVGTVVTYCFSAVLVVGENPACFRADISTKQVTAVPPPLDELAPTESEPPPTATLEHTDAGLVACTPAQVCHTLPIATDPSTHEVTISDDGMLVATKREHHAVETWDVASGKRIARFNVAYGSGGHRGTSGGEWLAFWSHDVVAMFTEEGGPVSDGTVYAASGKRLGTFGSTAGDMPVRMHDDVWLAITTAAGGDMVLVDAATDRVLGGRDLRDGSYAMSPDFVVQLHDQPFGAIDVFDRKLKLVTKLPPPPNCP